MSQPQARTNPTQFRLRFISIALVFVAVFFATNGFGIVGQHYPRAIENDPLIDPLQVKSVQNNTLQLADGRSILVDPVGDPLDEMVTASDGRVDVEFEDGSQNVVVFAKTRGWICGTPWARLVNIPLFPDDVPINRRQVVGFGKFVGKKGVVDVQARR